MSLAEGYAAFFTFPIHNFWLYLLDEPHLAFGDSGFVPARYSHGTPPRSSRSGRSVAEPGHDSGPREPAVGVQDPKALTDLERDGFEETEVRSNGLARQVHGGVYA